MTRLSLHDLGHGCPRFAYSSGTRVSQITEVEAHDLGHGCPLCHFDDGHGCPRLARTTATTWDTGVPRRSLRAAQRAGDVNVHTERPAVAVESGGRSPRDWRRAEDRIVQQLIDAVEAAKDLRGLNAADITARSGVSRRAVVQVRKLQVRPTLRTLLAIADAVGLELRISVRAKRTADTLINAASPPPVDAPLVESPIQSLNQHEDSHGR